MKYPMKHQRTLLKKYGLNPKKWIVMSENGTEMKAVRRYSGIACILNKKRVTGNEQRKMPVQLQRKILPDTFC